MAELNSSNLASCEYAEATRTLTIVFRDGRSYMYTSVDRDTADGLTSAASPGEFFQRNIRNRFPYKRIA